jgi:hypothetical protein
VLYYGNGGPGPHTKLLRVHAPEDGDCATWRSAPAERWYVNGGWQPIDHAQLDIQHLGEFFMIDPSEVEQAQQQMRERAARFSR